MKSRLAVVYFLALAPAFSFQFVASPLWAADYLATFDSFSEGVIGTSFTDGGITFAGYTHGLETIPNFIAELDDPTYMGPSFSAPNGLGFGGYVPGPGSGFGRVLSVTFAAPVLAQHVELDVWDLNFQPGNTLTLTGFANGIPLDSVSFAELGFDSARNATEHTLLSLTGGPFDNFVLTSAGTLDQGASFLQLDNVRITPTPEPATVVLAALAGLALLAIRWRSR